MTDQPKPTKVNVESAENVNVPGDPAAHPAVIYLVAFVTFGVLVGFGWATFAVLNKDIQIDAATRGAVIQTWNNLAVAAAAVWTSSTLIAGLKGQKS